LADYRDVAEAVAETAAKVDLPDFAVLLVVFDVAWLACSLLAAAAEMVVACQFIKLAVPL